MDLVVIGIFLRFAPTARLCLVDLLGYACLAPGLPGESLFLPDLNGLGGDWLL